MARRLLPQLKLRVSVAAALAKGVVDYDCRDDGSEKRDEDGVPVG